MEAILVAAFALVGDVIMMIKDAKTASTEKHADIVGRLNAARAKLAEAADAAHQALVEESEATRQAIDAARKP